MQSTPLDTHQLKTFIELGFSDYREIFEDFTGQIPHYLERIHNAIRDADTAAFKATVHSLRGMASLFGCITLTQRLAQLEHHLELKPELAHHIHSELHSLWQGNLEALHAWEKSVPEFNA
ncbi:MAG: Hpt domain [Verrucomicrobiota bacterium]|jgi:HPt (histidine-containing phosphotransfer) domain-containing protein